MTHVDNQKTRENLIATLADVGALWAAHGLRAGKLALQTSALTLEKTAKALDELARAFDDQRVKTAEKPPIDATPIDAPTDAQPSAPAAGEDAPKS